MITQLVYPSSWPDILVPYCRVRSPQDRALMWPATATTAALCFLAALAVAAALRIMVHWLHLSLTRAGIVLQQTRTAFGGI
jgi:hypothetical protein